MKRHLLPAEIDLLLDGEVGFGTAPLKAHVRRCEECRAELDSARALVRQLEQLPRLAPSPMFSAAVMNRVHVYVPWYIALGDRVRSLVPQSGPARIWAGALGLVILTAMSSIGVIMATRLDAVIFAVDLVYMRIQAWGSAVFYGAVSAALGDQALAAARSAGALGLLLLGALVLLTTAGAAGVVRTLVRVRGR